MANFCSHCGAKLNSNANFCANCGTKVIHEDTSEKKSTQKSDNRVANMATAGLVGGIIGSSTQAEAEASTNSVALSDDLNNFFGFDSSQLEAVTGNIEDVTDIVSNVISEFHLPDIADQLIDVSSDIISSAFDTGVDIAGDAIASSADVGLDVAGDAVSGFFGFF